MLGYCLEGDLRILLIVGLGFGGSILAIAEISDLFYGGGNVPEGAVVFLGVLVACLV